MKGTLHDHDQQRDSITERTNFEMLESLLKVFVAGADRPSEPAERVLDVPLDQLSALRVGAPHFHQLLGCLAVF